MVSSKYSLAELKSVSLLSRTLRSHVIVVKRAEKQWMPISCEIVSSEPFAGYIVGAENKPGSFAPAREEEETMTINKVIKYLGRTANNATMQAPSEVLFHSIIVFECYM